MYISKAAMYIYCCFTDALLLLYCAALLGKRGILCLHYVSDFFLFLFFRGILCLLLLILYCCFTALLYRASGVSSADTSHGDFFEDITKFLFYYYYYSFCLGLLWRREPR